MIREQCECFDPLYHYPKNEKLCDQAKSGGVQENSTKSEKCVDDRAQRLGEPSTWSRCVCPEPCSSISYYVQWSSTRFSSRVCEPFSVQPKASYVEGKEKSPRVYCRKKAHGKFFLNRFHTRFSRKNTYVPLCKGIFPSLLRLPSVVRYLQLFQLSEAENGSLTITVQMRDLKTQMLQEMPRMDVSCCCVQLKS